MSRERFVVAAAQTSPVFHDKAGTLDRTCEWIERAGDADVDLLVFPETFFPGFPYWMHGGSREQWVERVVELGKNSLAVDDEALDVIGEAIADNDLHVVLGTNERDDRPGSETLYNSMFFFDRDGRLVRRHRKLVPTTNERAVWGRGDPADLAVHETDIGTVGGLICYENHMTLSKAALCAMGEEIHPAVWPGFWHQETSSPGTKRVTDDPESITHSDIYPAMREYAFETQTFVVSCSAYIPDDELEGYVDPSGNLATGGSMLVDPTGLVRAGPVFGEESLLTADFARDERRAAKTYFDAVGHYTRWDAVSLRVSDAVYDPLQRDDAAGRHALPGLYEFRERDLERLAAAADTDTATVERVIEALSGE